MRNLCSLLQVCWANSLWVFSTFCLMRGNGRHHGRFNVRSSSFVSFHLSWFYCEGWEDVRETHTHTHASILFPFLTVLECTWDTNGSWGRGRQGRSCWAWERSCEFSVAEPHVQCGVACWLYKKQDPLLTLRGWPLMVVAGWLLNR